MLPANELQNFPMFVPDQVLTSENLNQLFDHLDSEGRMTRTNLIGIGIVCGMEVKNGIDGNGQFIAITKGTGVTSAGYLVTTPENGATDTTETKYHKFKNFDAVQCRYYDPFVNVSNKTQRFPLWELKETSETTGTSPLNTIPGGLNDKVVMIFVELLEKNNKNCDPSSCDDKGINVDVTFRPLLVNKTDAVNLVNTGGLGVSGVSFNGLQNLAMPRWDVINTHPVTSDHIINAYKKVLTPVFIQNVENVLTAAYDMFKPLVKYEYPTNPFSQLAEKFAFLANPVLTSGQTVHIQYYYDFFSDMMQAYEEFCKTGKELMGVCCPDEALFPRHLLLGEAVPLADNAPSAFRHYFIYSPLFECRNLIYTLRILFRRMHLMWTSFDTPTSVVAGAASNDTNIRVTPSQLGNMPISHKAIPYYYKLNLSASSLHKFWSVEKKLRNRTHQTLSYNANVYATDQFVLTPLLYDLEPNNFLRVEGVVGKNITGVLPTIQKRIDDNRLPVQVITLKTGTPVVEGFDPKSMGCNTQDLEINFDIVRREWEAIIGKTIEYLDDNKTGAKNIIDSGHAGQLHAFIVDLQLSKTFIEDTKEQLPAFAAVYEDFIPVFERIESKAQQIRLQLMAMIKDPANKTLDRVLAEDIIDHMDEVVLSCRKGAFRAIYQDYSNRLEEIYAKMYFSGFAAKNPGLQHKAGVPVGGTYILVYHAKPVTPSLKLSNKQKASVKPGTFVMQGVIEDSNGNPVMGAEVREKNAAKVTTSINGKFTLSLSQLPTIISVKANGFDPYEEIIQSPDKKKTIQLKAEVIASAGVASLANGTVIADFYLPYICCSDCAPIQFVIQEPPPNKPPVARAGDDISLRLPDDTVTLDGEGSTDPDEDIVSYSWAYKSGPAQFNIESPATVSTNVKDLEEGEYIFTLTVTDADGATSTDEVKITVLPAFNIPPGVNAGADKEIIFDDGSASVTLIGTATDSDGPQPTVLWTKKPAPTGATAVPNIVSPTSLTTEVTFTDPGVYVFTLTATDEDGDTASDDVTITVTEPPNQLPVAKIAVDKPVITLPDNSVKLDSAGSFDPEGGPLTFAWTKSPAGVAGNFSNPTGATTDVTGLVAGNYTFTLTVKDNKADTAAASVNVTVNQAQVAKNCGKLTTISSLFNKMESVDPPNFQGFKGDIFIEYRDVEAYFRLMEAVVDASTDAQIDFFVNTKINGMPINQLLFKWMIKLMSIERNPNFKTWHLLALSLYRVLVNLAVYIACIQDKDIVVAKMPTLVVFDQMKQDLTTFPVPLTTDQKKVLAQIKKVLEAALINLQDSGEITVKPMYGAKLQELITILTALGIA